MSFNENLRKFRKQCGYTQDELARKIEINRVNVAYYENGTKVPSLAVTEKIADVLHCSVDGLLGRKNFNNRKED